MVYRLSLLIVCFSTLKASKYVDTCIAINYVSIVPRSFSNMRFNNCTDYIYNCMLIMLEHNCSTSNKIEK
jgi:hypothetical protein